MKKGSLESQLDALEKENRNVQIASSLAENMSRLDRILNVDKNFDILKRVFQIGEKQGCFYFISGFYKDDVMQKLLQYFADRKTEDTPKSLGELLEKCMPYGDLEVIREQEKLLASILSGKPAMFVDGFDAALSLDFREYPARNVTEPDKDKAMRGSKDGFVETLIFNTALIRRRIRTPSFTIQMMSVGKSSKTDIAICYMENRADKKFLKEVTDRIAGIDVDALTMTQESLAECLFQAKWFDPFPKFKFSERPDTAAACILEGSVVLLVDNSPAAMILPVNIFDIVEEADDYYFPPITGTYLRFSRLIINFLALVLTPIFLLLSKYPDMIPAGFEFIQVKEAMNIPLIWQFLILEFAIDGLRLASINTPNMLSTPLSVVSGLVIGEFTVSSGWFNAEAMLYMAFVSIANYTQVNFELGYALKFLRLITLLLTEFLGIWGFAGGLIFAALCLGFNKTIAGKSYLYPLIPFRFKELARRLLRVSLPASTKAAEKAGKTGG